MLVRFSVFGIEGAVDQLDMAAELDEVHVHGQRRNGIRGDEDALMFPDDLHEPGAVPLRQRFERYPRFRLGRQLFDQLFRLPRRLLANFLSALLREVQRSPA